MQRLGSCVLALACMGPIQAVAGQLDITTFNTLRRGMSESEVLVRAGPPDLIEDVGVRSADRGAALVRGGVNQVDVIRFRNNRIESNVKQLHYIPGPGEHDPQLTVITITGGLVSNLERTKVFGHTWSYEPQDEDESPEREVYSDDELKVQRADRTLKAAEYYAETRNRLKEQARLDESEEGTSEPAAIYRVNQPDGTVYYGDRPPEETGYLTE
jgi:hypothetical protein